MTTRAFPTADAYLTALRTHARDNPGWTWVSADDDLVMGVCCYKTPDLHSKGAVSFCIDSHVFRGTRPLPLQELEWTDGIIALVRTCEEEGFVADPNDLPADPKDLKRLLKALRGELSVAYVSRHQAFRILCRLSTGHAWIDACADLVPGAGVSFPCPTLRDLFAVLGVPKEVYDGP